MLVALHVHTDHSACSESPVEAIGGYCRRHEIEAIAVTDHDVIQGAIELRRVAPWLNVIVGEEISSSQGEIVGLFLNEKIEPGRPLRETCLIIKDQGGLVYVPHPLDKFKAHRVRSKHLAEVIDLVDIIEVYNAKVSLNIYNTKAGRLAERHGKVAAVGSDSHYVNSIGTALNVMEPFEGPSDFLEKLAKAKFRTGGGSLPATWWVRVRKLVGAGQ
jgi:hypothetical protein